MRANILRAAFVGSALCLLIGAILGHQTAAGHALLCVGAIAGVTRTLRAILAYAGSPSRERVQEKGFACDVVAKERGAH